jgi:glycosyltransferase involved in cell wall biosynthesis
LTLELPPLAIATPRILFDLSRLLRQRRRTFPTGVDRIDLAIGLDLAARFGSECRFVHASPVGPASVPGDLGRAFLEALSARWATGGAADAESRGLRATLAAGRMRGALGAFRALATPETTYVNASHSGLPLRPGALERVDPQRRMRRLAYIHDIIPLEFPEYQTARSVRRFEAFLQALAAAPIRFATNSADTARRLSAYAAAQGWDLEGVEPAVPRMAAQGARVGAAGALRAEARAILDGPRPYFIVIGTIEPRKNHLLLLHLWREFAAEGDAPTLVIVGRRGWENEMVVDMLERCAAIAPHLREFGDLSDAETQALLRGARALLFPSFAEGLGLPLLEARAVGAPAIVSDLPAFREIAPADAQFLSPLDGPAWKRAIRALAA